MLVTDLWKLSDLQTKNKSGKAALTLPKGAKVLPPSPALEVESYVAAVSNEGRMLIFPLSDLPVMSKGKGNKIIGIPTARVQAREEFVMAVVVVGQKDVLRIHAGKRHVNMKFSELDHYKGERGRRGNKLPRGFQKVDRVEVVKPSK